MRILSFAETKSHLTQLGRWKSRLSGFITGIDGLLNDPEFRDCMDELNSQSLDQLESSRDKAARELGRIVVRIQQLENSTITPASEASNG